MAVLLLMDRARQRKRTKPAVALPATNHGARYQAKHPVPDGQWPSDPPPWEWRNLVGWALALVGLVSALLVVYADYALKAGAGVTLAACCGGLIVVARRELR